MMCAVEAVAEVLLVQVTQCVDNGTLDMQVMRWNT